MNMPCAGCRAPHTRRPRGRFYVPIAYIPVNIFRILAMGAAAAFVLRHFARRVVLMSRC